MYDKPTSPFENRVYALCIEDMRFKYAYGRIVMNPMTVVDADMAPTGIIWRYQKNINHCEVVEFEASPSNQMFCFCLASLGTYQRVIQLCDKPNTSITVYKKNPKSRNCSWMTKRGIEWKLRLAAWKVFYPKEKLMTGSLEKITLHSIRIQAAMLFFCGKCVKYPKLVNCNTNRLRSKCTITTPLRHHGSSQEKWNPLTITTLHQQSWPTIRTSKIMNRIHSESNLHLR